MGDILADVDSLQTDQESSNSKIAHFLSATKKVLFLLVYIRLVSEKRLKRLFFSF